PRRSGRAGARAGTARESRRRPAARGGDGRRRRDRPGGVAGSGARHPRHRTRRRDRAAPSLLGAVRRGQRRRHPTRGRRGPGGGPLRPTVIYGERDRWFTPRVIRAARLRVVPQIGPGTNRLSCVYAGNVAAAAVAALDAPLAGFRPYNVTNDGPPALSQREFFAAFAAALGRRYWSIPIPTALA